MYLIVIIYIPVITFFFHFLNTKIKAPEGAPCDGLVPGYVPTDNKKGAPSPGAETARAAGTP